MGKYLVRVESMDGFKTNLPVKFGEGFEADRFLIVTMNDDKDSVNHTVIHDLSVDMLSDLFIDEEALIAASIMTKAKHEMCELRKHDAALGLLWKLLGVDEEEED